VVEGPFVGEHVLQGQVPVGVHHVKHLQCRGRCFLAEIFLSEKWRFCSIYCQK
jgi:hypothetical protein